MSLAEETTEKYKRLLDPHAATFTGFKFAKIPSREPVERNLKNFLKRTREAQFLTVALIKAEWGEGKTDAFERYIKPEVEKKGDIAYLVSTSTIVNKLSKASTLFPTNPPESVTLLATIFYSIKDELKAKDEDYSLFPKETQFEDVLSYIKKTLENHLSSPKGKKRRRMYIFIDEFEEILLQPLDIQKKFLSGIKELINGQLRVIHKGGKFEGCVHFIIACTPYAYNRLKEDVNLKEIFGSISSRIGPSVIELPQISREESLKFLIDLINYCYDGKIPKTFPVKSSGILNGICTISQRNLRPMIQLLIELFSAASIDGKLRVIDYDFFIETLRGREISIYGEVTSCIDNDLLSKIETTLLNVKNYGEKCLRLFKLLAGELKPFSVQELAQRLNIYEDEVHNFVEIINQELKKIGISRAIARFEPLKEDKEIEKVLESIKPVSGQIILLRNKIPVTIFKDELVHFEIKGQGELSPVMIFPRENDEFIRLFETYEPIEIDEDEAETFHRKIKDFFDFTARQRRFMLSKELILQLYPSPLVMQLDFIMERPKRMSLWREAIKNFADMQLALRDAFIEVINNSDRFKITGPPEVFSMKYRPRPGTEINIATAIYSSTTGINMNDILSIKELLKREKIDLILLVYTGSLDEEASQELNEMPKVLPVHLKTIRAQQLIALSLARRRDIAINENLLKGRLKQMFYETDFTRLFDSWAQKCKEKGFLVEDLRKTFGEKDESLAQAMIYYIETVKKEFTLEDVFEQMKKLKSFRLYGGKGISFDPFDIDITKLDKFKDRLRDYHLDLLRNSFIRETESGKVEIICSPIERRILDLIKSGKRNLEGIKRSFIFFAQNKRILEQVYLPILEMKGYIKINKDEILPISRQELEQETLKLLEAYLSKVNEKRKQPWWNFAHICISKERESKIIMLEEFDQYIRSLREKYDNPEIRYDEELSIRLLRHMRILLDYYNNSLEPIVNEAYAHSKELEQEIEGHIDDIEHELNRILEEYNKYSEKKYSLENIEEYLSIKERLSEFRELIKKQYARDEIESGVSLLDDQFEVRRKYEGRPRYFYFKARKEEASFFNYKIYEMKRALDAFRKKYEEIKNRCAEIRRIMDDSLIISNNIKSKLIKFNIPGDYVLSSHIHSLLMKCQMKPVKAKPLAILHLEDIEMLFKDIHDALKEFEGKIEGSITYLRIILAKEKILIPMINTLNQKKDNITSFFGRPEEVSAISEEIDRKVHEYKNLTEELAYGKDTYISLDDIQQLSEKTAEKLSNITTSLENLDRRLMGLCSRFIEDLEAYKQNVNKFMQVVKEAGIDITALRRSFESIVDEAIANLKDLSQGYKVKITWKQVQDDLAHLKRKLFDNVRKMLSEDEFNVLFYVVEASTIRKLFDYSELVNVITTKLGRTQEEADQIIESLVNKKLLKKSFSLPI